MAKSESQKQIDETKAQNQTSQDRLREGYLSAGKSVYDKDADPKHSPFSNTQAPAQSVDDHQRLGEGEKLDDSQALDLANKEMSATDIQATQSNLDSQESSSLYRKGKGKKKDSKKTKSRGRAMKKGVLGSIGLIAMVAVFIFTTLAGPFEFIHLSRILQGEFAALNLMSDRSAYRLIKTLNSTTSEIGHGKIHDVLSRTRIPLEAKFRTLGLEVVGTSVTGKATHLRVNNEVIDLRTTSPRQAWNKWRSVARESGMGKISTAIKSRVVFNGYGIKFRVLQQPRAWLGQAAQAIRQSVWGSREAYIKAGALNSDGLRVTDPASPETAPDPEAPDGINREIADVADGADIEISDELARARSQAIANGSSPRNVRYATANAFRNVNRGTGSPSVQLIAMTVCAGSGLNRVITSLEFFNRYLPSMRLGMEAISIGQQIESGEAVDPIELSVFAENLYGDKDSAVADGDIGSWAGAAGINYLATGSATGTEPDPAILVGDVTGRGWAQVSSSFDRLGLPETKSGNGVVSLSNICDTLSTSFVQAALLVLSISACAASTAVAAFTGGAGTPLAWAVCAGAVAITTFGAVLVGNFVFNKAVESIARSVVGEEITIGAQGALYGNIVSQGARFSSNELARELGGVSISHEDELTLVGHLQEEEAQLFAQKGLLARLFSTSEPKSLTSNLMAEINTSFGGKKGLSPSGFASMFSGTLNKLLMRFGVVAEAEPFYDVPKIAWPIDLMMSDENDIDTVDNAAYLTKKYGSDAEIHQAFSGCVSPSITNYIQGNIEDPDEDPTKIPPKDYYLAEVGCTDAGLLQDLNRYRLYTMDMQTLLSLGCWAGDDKSCQEMGLSSGGQPGGSIDIPEGLECPPNIGLPNPLRHNYYKMPPSLNGTYNVRVNSVNPEQEPPDLGGNTRDVAHGSLELICAIYTAAERFAAMDESNGMVINLWDLNGMKHSTHQWGVAVDLYASGNGRCAANWTAGCTEANYDDEATAALGRAFVSTGVVTDIYWCEPGASEAGGLSGSTGSMDAIREYADSIGKPVNIVCVPPHKHHFHISISCDYAGPSEGSWNTQNRDCDGRGGRTR